MSSFIHATSHLRAPLFILLASTLAACGGDGGSGTAVGEPHTWDAAQSMLNARVGHTATLLSNGKVLVAGGESSNSSVIASAELYDPSTGTWTATGSMNTARTGHTATLLANGDVLVAGGAITTAGTLSNTAEIYDSTDGTWSVTDSINVASDGNAAVLLSNGNVLVANGTNAELYDSATGTWTTTSNPGGGGYFSGENLMTLLPNSGVLAILNNGPQVYDPSANVWTPTNPIPGVDYEYGPYLVNLTTLKDGTVLTAGGFIYPGGTQTNFPPVNSAFVYQPSNGSWSVTGNMTAKRSAASASLLQDGTVLVFGGTSDASSELFDPSTGTWSATGNMVTALGTNGTATVLSDGRVLVAGGIAVNDNPDAPANAPLSNAEIYTP